MMNQKVLIIVGPTASGKSALGVELARRFNGEIVSADSRQVYKGLDIGTGKVTKREMKGVRHHLLDVATPKKIFSAGNFVKKAHRAIHDISTRGKLPIIVGGTGFYIDALLGRIVLSNVQADKKLRYALRKRTAPQLYAQLRRIDPMRAKAMDTPSERNNTVRLIRAIEIAHGKPKKMNDIVSRSYDALWIGIAPKDPELRNRINKRLKERIKKGMVAEAKRLQAGGLSFKRMCELGLEYRSLARHLKGEITKDEMERELQSDIWRYARKQIGYWKRNKGIAWFGLKQNKGVEARVRQWLKK